MKALTTKALTTKCLRSKALSLRIHPVRIVRALRYPTYQRLAIQRALVPSFGSMMIGVGNLYSLGLDALHGSGSLTVMTAHIVTHVVLVVPIGSKKGMA
jgi:hypothetical protein